MAIDDYLSSSDISNILCQQDGEVDLPVVRARQNHHTGETPIGHDTINFLYKIAENSLGKVIEFFYNGDKDKKVYTKLPAAFNTA